MPSRAGAGNRATVRPFSPRNSVGVNSAGTNTSIIRTWQRPICGPVSTTTRGLGLVVRVQARLGSHGGRRPPSRMAGGRTGFPMVDAGQRQLWHTGWMHNRVRMVSASLLVKNLGIHWQVGEQWFWDTLVDADPASNPANWQWVAGSGADASPFFRIFNPVTQAAKFDPDGRYVGQWIPELSTADYPEPVVDLKASRREALDAYGSLPR
ncbi:deoxyribodipyrimidine photo-lyase [Arthrobacter sp. Hiyo8]|nr:deoxyribodipyrimidine photo-lyase [Arthrobacter sp. Hiyo8]